MNEVMQIASAWLEHGWRLLLALSLGLVLVALLRRPFRHLFGAVLAFRLWMLVPLSLLAAELPHGAQTRITVVPAMTLHLAPATTPVRAASVPDAVMPWSLVLCVSWGLAVVLLTLAALSDQRRFHRHLRGAVRVDPAGSRWPVLTAVHADVGPALVGAWRVRIVLPADFAERYDATEQALILAHETMHARRRDGVLCLLAQLLRIAFWHHPLVWWAWRAFRHDQELACDAAVLAEYRGARRSYATAMLKTQVTTNLLPVGCPWSPRHPVTERIAMLKSDQPNPATRRAGALATMLVGTAVAGAVYAASPASTGSSAVDADRFTLTVDVATLGHPASLHFTTCTRAGEAVRLNGSDGPGFSWDGRFTVAPAGKAQLEVGTVIHTRSEQGAGGAREMSGQPAIRTEPGKTATIVFGGKAEPTQPAGNMPNDGTLRIDLTPSPGCSAAVRAAAWSPVQVRQHVQNLAARDAARLLAEKGGFVLVNPEALDDRPVSFHYEQLSAISAMQLLADIDGKRAVFDGMRVHFEPK